MKITLLNASNLFVERLRLHEFAANREVKRRPLANILRGMGVSFVQGHVSSIDTEQRVLNVEIETGTRRIGYDKLLYGHPTSSEQKTTLRAYISGESPNVKCLL